ncbi:hypothetical protein GVN20_04520 [Runella sp. CRIBMP]|uniref:hypothetical protein n=1 Tax=Runella sp. CRIBMP TaxID=2683261 RepID=UPI0014122A3D|nr:hypothetical protein [Runella sp. CRIBMP]NBB18613.1 hypothetical protein [Runella sp. CRIBMP]
MTFAASLRKATNNLGRHSDVPSMLNEWNQMHACKNVFVTDRVLYDLDQNPYFRPNANRDLAFVSSAFHYALF